MQFLALSLVRDIASCYLRLVPQPPGHQHTDQSVPTLPTVLLEFHTMRMMSWQRLPEQGKKEAPLFQMGWLGQTSFLAVVLETSS